MRAYLLGVYNLNILHYFLGFPPYRTGGLTMYAFGLAKEQKIRGHEVSMMWPGEIEVLSDKPKLRVKEGPFGIKSIELKNPLPVPLRNGVLDTKKFMKPCEKTIFLDYLRLYKPDIIHVHTLMGLYKEFFEAASELGIKIVYTTHDYFGLCPKVNLFYNGDICLDSGTCINCYACNHTALSYKKIKIMQSGIYRKFKDSKLVKVLRERNIRHEEALEINEGISLFRNDEYSHHYEELRKYYMSIFKFIDCFHFNSVNTKNIYCRFLAPKNSEVIPILHNKISDNRKRKSYGKTLKISYLASGQQYKGYFLLKEVLDEIYSEGMNDFSLNMFFSPKDKSPYMNVSQRYSFEQLSDIFDSTDVLVVPSIWHETFGLVVYEALSYGVPVIVTDRVGAKDILNDNDSIVISPEKASLKEAVLKVYNNRNILIGFNEAILKLDKSKFDYSEHVNKIMNLYEQA